MSDHQAVVLWLAIVDSDRRLRSASRALLDVRSAPELPDTDKIKASRLLELSAAPPVEDEEAEALQLQRTDQEGEPLRNESRVHTEADYDVTNWSEGVDAAWEEDNAHVVLIGDFGVEPSRSTHLDIASLPTGFIETELVGKPYSAGIVVNFGGERGIVTSISIEGLTPGEEIPAGVELQALRVASTKQILVDVEPRIHLPGEGPEET